MQHVSIVRGSTSSSLVSSAADTDHIDHSGTETNGISSRISLRHGLSVDRLRLLNANPPETKITNLYELGSLSNSINLDGNTNTTIGDPTNLITVNGRYPANDNSSHNRSTKTMITMKRVLMSRNTPICGSKTAVSSVVLKTRCSAFTCRNLRGIHWCLMICLCFPKDLVLRSRCGWDHS